MTTAINAALMQIPKRAERTKMSYLVRAFVEVGPLLVLLSAPEHQLIYGRRGTGKTHALRYLSSIMERNGDVVAYIDMRTIGSSAGLYVSEGINIVERATQLLQDTLSTMHDSLLDAAWNRGIAEQSDASLLPSLDRLIDASSRVEIEGEFEYERTHGTSSESANEDGLEFGLSPPQPSVKLRWSSQAKDANHSETRTVNTGRAARRVHFGEVVCALRAVVDAMSERRLWILIDEWSSVPIDLQPLLADFLRRCVLPVQECVVKIGAIEQRSRFRVDTEAGDYMGLELGADITASLSLDEILRDDASSSNTRDFVAELLFRHVIAHSDERDFDGRTFRNAKHFFDHAFKRGNGLDELVAAGEGVPRDLINIAAAAAQTADNRSIDTDDVRHASRHWFMRDKYAALSSDARVRALFEAIVHEVVTTHHSRTFLLEEDRHENFRFIKKLYDARLLHIIKRGVAVRERPGRRFALFSIDYGCYAEQLASGVRMRRRDMEALLSAPGHTVGGQSRDEVVISLAHFDFRRYLVHH